MSLEKLLLKFIRIKAKIMKDRNQDLHGLT